MSIVYEGVRATCRHCRQAIVSGYTPYGVVWLAVEKDPTGRVNRLECPAHRCVLVRTYGEHEPLEPEALQAACQE